MSNLVNYKTNKFTVLHPSKQFYNLLYFCSPFYNHVHCCKMFLKVVQGCTWFHLVLVCSLICWQQATINNNVLFIQCILQQCTRLFKSVQFCTAVYDYNQQCTILSIEYNYIHFVQPFTTENIVVKQCTRLYTSVQSCTKVYMVEL